MNRRDDGCTRMNISLIDMIGGISYSHDFNRDGTLNKVDEVYKLKCINEREYPNIYLDHKITDGEFNKAINIIITFFMQQKLNRVEIDLDERNDKLAPATEMTLEEIEKELGHKVKIVNKKK